MGGVVGAGPPLAPAARARIGSAAGPVAGLSRDLASGIIGDLTASRVADISLAVCVYFFILFLGRCGYMGPWALGPPYTKKKMFFQ